MWCTCRNLKERVHLEELGIDGRIILKWKWIHVGEDRNKW
jgi:hypothetical protein